MFITIQKLWVLITKRLIKCGKAVTGVTKNKFGRKSWEKQCSWQLWRTRILKGDLRMENRGFKGTLVWLILVQSWVVDEPDWRSNQHKEFVLDECVLADTSCLCELVVSGAWSAAVVDSVICISQDTVTNEDILKITDEVRPHRNFHV